MKVIEKTQARRTQNYLVSMPASEFRLLTSALNAVIDTAGVANLTEVMPVGEKKIIQLQEQLNDALSADATLVRREPAMAMSANTSPAD